MNRPGSLLLKFSLLLPALILSGSIIGQTFDVDVDFNGKTHTLFYHRTLPKKFNLSASPESFEKFYLQLDSVLYEDLIESMEKTSERLGYSDYTYALFSRAVASKVMEGNANHISDMFWWFLLAKSGVQVKANLAGDKVIVSAFAEESLPGSRVDFTEKGCYVDLSSVGLGSGSIQGAVSPFVVPDEGRPMSFYPEQLPSEIKRQSAKQKLNCSLKGSAQSIDLNYDKGYVDFLLKYPGMLPKAASRSAVSAELEESMLAALQKHTENISAELQLRCILDFVRTGFTLTPETGSPSQKRASSPEEMVHLKGGDYEDHAAIFMWLVEELLVTDCIPVVAGDRVFAAVKLARTTGVTIQHNGNTYVVCDPSDPSNTLAPGELPAGIAGPVSVLR